MMCSIQVPACHCCHDIPVHSLIASAATIDANNSCDVASGYL